MALGLDLLENGLLQRKVFVTSLGKSGHDLSGQDRSISAEYPKRRFRHPYAVANPARCNTAKVGSARFNV
ncbi:MAG: hypothetical protein ACI8PT_000304 [Gammaproteobacteria bacterium]|jgi:hypothetical protein